MAPGQARTQARFRYCPLSTLLPQITVTTVPPTTSPVGHREATRLSEGLQLDFNTAASEFSQSTRDVFEEATTWPIPGDLAQHLHLLCDKHTLNVASMEQELAHLLYTMSMLPIEYKEEIAETGQWKNGAQMVLEADRMITTLNFPTSVENRLRESRIAYEGDLQQVEEWKMKRKNVLEVYWRTTLAAVQFFKSEPHPDVTQRLTMAEMARDNFGRGIAVRDEELSSLRRSLGPRFEAVLQRNHPGMQEIREMENKIGDHLFALLHSISIVETTVDYQAAWTAARLDVLRDILKAPSHIFVDSTANPNRDDKSARLIHDQLVRNECPISMENYEDPTRLKCNHIFTLKDIVPWVDEHRDCPMCREKVDFDDVQRLDVERVEAQAECELVTGLEGEDLEA